MQRALSDPSDERLVEVARVMEDIEEVQLWEDLGFMCNQVKAKSKEILKTVWAAYGER